LAFPGKVLADAKGGRLFVSDSNHGRIVIASLKDGSLIRKVEGFKNPQGLALSEDGQALYACDLGANTIAQIDLKSGGVKALAANLNSPWDLALLKGSLYIAMAGSHQIWSLDLKSNECKAWAGNGREDLLDGPLEKASLAQPSGISSDGEKLFSADSESSSIRVIDKDVKTLNGKGLFEYGDNEGDASEARLQHPVGIHCSDGLIYVADTFNNRIKTMDPKTGALKFLGPATLDEPGGLWTASGKLYIADTNNHAVKVMDLKTGAVSSFVIKGL
jgi:DNA-binding beta-propeller fold protein YncE